MYYQNVLDIQILDLFSIFSIFRYMAKYRNVISWIKLSQWMK